MIKKSQPYKGTTPNNVYLRNQILIMQYLQRNPVSTRASIAKSINLTQAAVSKITANLIERGIIEEVGYIPGEMGRRSIGIQLSNKSHRVVGAKLSRRHFSVGVFDFSGQCINSVVENFDSTISLQNILKKMRSSISTFIQSYPVLAIGVAVPGPFFKKESLVLQISQMGDSSQEAIVVSDFLNKKVFDNIPVIIEHDANAAVMADWWFNIEDTPLQNSLAHFLVGEGVGCGFISKGEVFRSFSGSSCEIGHVSVNVHGRFCHCGNRGCLETYCSSIAFANNALEQRKNYPDSTLHQYQKLTAEIIFNEANQGDPLSVFLVKQVGEYIGFGVINIINLFCPEVILICNEMSRGGKLLIDQIITTAKSHLNPSLFEKTTIQLSTFKEDDILVGAAAVAIDYCLSKPSSMAK